MATLTIRNVGEETKQKLRMRAARHGTSLEQEVRTILQQAARETDRNSSPRHDNLYDAIRALVEPYGGFDLEVPERALAERDPPTFD